MVLLIAKLGDYRDDAPVTGIVPSRQTMGVITMASFAVSCSLRPIVIKKPFSVSKNVLTSVLFNTIELQIGFPIVNFHHVIFVSIFI